VSDAGKKKLAGARRSRKSLRAACLNATAFANRPSKRWVLETPYDIRDGAAIDLLLAYKTNMAKRRKNP
jgi:hypothetical protein